MTVAELINILQALPQDVIVEALNECGDSRVLETYGVYLVDWTDEKYKGSLRGGQKVVFIEG